MLSKADVMVVLKIEKSTRLRWIILSDAYLTLRSMATLLSINMTTIATPRQH